MPITVPGQGSSAMPAALMTLPRRFISDLTGREGCTTRMLGEVTTSVTGAKSFSGS